MAKAAVTAHFEEREESDVLTTILELKPELTALAEKLPEGMLQMPPAQAGPKWNNWDKFFDWDKWDKDPWGNWSNWTKT